MRRAQLAIIVIWGTYTAILLSAGIGWVLNVVEIAHIEVWNGLAAIRCFGVVVPPLGAVLGWL